MDAVGGSIEGMTVPHDDDRDPIPSQAELDEMDMAELTRTSAESHVAYPTRDEPAGPPPAALVRDAWVCWWIAAAAGLASAVFLLINLGSISGSLQERLRTDMERAIAEAAAKATKAANPPSMPADGFHGLAHLLPPVMLMAIVALLVVQFLLLRGVSVHHSRNSRSIFLAAVLINLVCIPTGMDLLRFADNAPSMVIVGWIQFGALMLAALCTLRPAVGRWLPAPRALRAGKLLRSDGGRA
ncbi:hypothetical protein GCM10010528_25720 [Gordonia defluvii]|jgi:hypothetical protein|uniref:DUF4328 domain-containing protein n=2 Tax=Gordoniaceae TaxID=85026 RepID=A0ABP6LLC6_9ACTN